MEVKIPEIKFSDYESDTFEVRNEDRGVHIINSPVIKFNGVFIFTGKGTPLNVVVAPIGSLYLRQDGGANTTLYIKESLTTSAGWVAK